MMEGDLSGVIQINRIIKKIRLLSRRPEPSGGGATWHLRLESRPWTAQPCTLPAALDHKPKKCTTTNDDATRCSTTPCTDFPPMAAKWLKEGGAISPNSVSGTEEKGPNDSTKAGGTQTTLVGRHNNRGHGRLWRATPTAREAVSPILHTMRYTQGFTVLATAVGVFWNTRAESFYFVMGALATSVAAKTLKNWIREPRPRGSAVTRSFGMPSTHSAMVTFMATYLLFYNGHKILEGGLGSLSHLELAYSALLVTFPVAVMWSRTALVAHTTKQVLAGGALGIVFAKGAWHLWNVKGPFGGDALSNQPQVQAWDEQIVGAKAGVLRFSVGIFRRLCGSSMSLPPQLSSCLNCP